MPPSCQRVIALVALKRRAVHRPWVCSVLWPYATPRRAVASLRSALWRLRPLGAEGLLVIDPQHLALAPGVAVDFHDATDQIEQLLEHGPGVDPDLADALMPALTAGELLEGWSDPWCGHQRSRYCTMQLIARDVLASSRENSGSELRVWCPARDS